MPGGWWHDSETAGRVICDLCPRECHLAEGDRGFCFVREYSGGQMQLTTYGRSTGFCIDPIEKKPLNHFYPGTSVLSFGTAGCNLGCKFCQNWDISKSREIRQLSEEATPETIAEAALQLGCQSVAFTYNDPVIWAEYAIDVARACHQRGIKTVAVTAGYISEAARQPFFEVMDAANVDLKAFNEDFYRLITLSHMQPVLDTLKWLADESDTWFEITNLIIPGENDSDDELSRMVDWILANLGDDVPVHFSAFHPDYRMTDKPRTPHETLLRAHSLAKEQGIRHAYVGNVNDEQHQSTYCPSCSTLLIQRDWYELGSYQLDGNRCGQCGHQVAGRFADQPGDWGRKRQPVRIQDYASKPNPRLQDPAMSSSADSPQSASPNTDFSPLSEPDQQRVHRATCQLLAKAVVGDASPDLADALGPAADSTVMGCFVTLKKDQQLRACCGVLNRPFSLADALQQAAVSTATRDRRFPPISPAELEGLKVDISLLHNFQPVDIPADQRQSVIQVGHHGLVIRQGNKSGLLLPVVAVDFGWDSEQFLRRVCHKAGLPEDAWQQDDASLQTFEVQVIEAAWDTSVLISIDDSALLQPAELSALADHSRQNLAALIAGATPNYYLTNCPDMMIHGLALQLTDPGSGGTIQSGRLSAGNKVPLQATLFQLVENLARALGRQDVKRQFVEQMQPQLLLLEDPIPHGSLETADPAAIDQQRAIVISDGEQSAWLSDRGQSAQQGVDELSELAKVTHLKDWQLVSYRSASTTSPFRFSMLRQASQENDNSTRAAAVAGRFYPGDADELVAMTDDLLGDIPDEKMAAAAVMVPHAGLVFSGRLAADVLKRVEIPSTVIIISPKHTPLGADWAIDPHAAWSIPGKRIETDMELAQVLADSIDGLELDEAAHRNEHGIEIELPLLSRLAPKTRVVGIAVGNASLADCQGLGDQLAGVLGTLPQQPLLVISSDMNHFANDKRTRQVDALALAAMESLDPAQLYETVTEKEISMCGMRPAVIVMQCLRQLGQLGSCSQVGYTTSADVSGDSSRVVGYAGLILQAKR